MMRVYLTDGAARYAALVDDAMQVVEARIREGFLPWIMQNIQREDALEDLPVIFVAEQDVVDRTVVTIDGGEARQTPPDDANQHKQELDRKLCKLLGMQPRDFIPSWLGLYFLYETEERCIFIRVEKILHKQHIGSPEGVACILLHELGHAIMDSRRPRMVVYSELSSNYRVLPGFTYAIEEAMANAIAYRALRARGMDARSAVMCSIAKFMQSQPAAYALGLEIAMASQDFDLTAYVKKWHQIRTGRPITADLNDWFLASGAGHRPCTRTDVKNQIACLK